VSRIHDVVIIGSGPAGYTAAIYAARASLQPLMIVGPQPGGQLTITTEVENYPGFPEGINGPELMEKMRDQAARFGTEIVEATVESVDFAKRPFTIRTDQGEHLAKTVIISTGASARLLGIPSEKEFFGFGVSACATCDGFFFKGKRVMVIGGGDTALEEANFLARFCTEVVVVHRRDQMRASKIMQERSQQNPKIRFILNATVEEVLGEKAPRHMVTGVKLRDTKTDAVSEHAIDGIFVAIGHQPNTAFLKGSLPLDAKDYVVVEPGSTRTRIAGVFAAGDVADSVYRQAVTAAGSGCQAAIDAERWLEAQGHGG
jgi:thioredoxin reductase (NADPH)